MIAELAVGGRFMSHQCPLKTVRFELKAHAHTSWFVFFSRYRYIPASNTYYIWIICILWSGPLVDSHRVAECRLILLRVLLLKHYYLIWWVLLHLLLAVVVTRQLFRSAGLNAGSRPGFFIFILRVNRVVVTSLAPSCLVEGLIILL